MLHRLSTICRVADTEVGAYLVCAEDDPFRIVDCYIPHQNASSATFSFTREGRVAAINHFTALNIAPWRWANFVFHTHPSTSAQPSGTDDRIFTEIINDDPHHLWTAQIIMSRHGDGPRNHNYHCRMAHRIPLSTDPPVYLLHVSTLSIGVSENSLPQLTDWARQEIAAKITSPTPSSTWGYSGSTSDRSYPTSSQIYRTTHPGPGWQKVRPNDPDDNWWERTPNHPSFSNTNTNTNTISYIGDDFSRAPHLFPLTPLGERAFDRNNSISFFASLPGPVIEREPATIRRALRRMTFMAHTVANAMRTWNISAWDFTLEIPDNILDFIRPNATVASQYNLTLTEDDWCIARINQVFTFNAKNNQGDYIFPTLTKKQSKKILARIKDAVNWANELNSLVLHPPGDQGVTLFNQSRMVQTRYDDFKQSLRVLTDTYFDLVIFEAWATAEGLNPDDLSDDTTEETPLNPDTPDPATHTDSPVVPPLDTSTEPPSQPPTEPPTPPLFA